MIFNRGGIALTPIRYIREHLCNFDKDFRNYVIRCFNIMEDFHEPFGDVLYSVLLYICAKMQGYSAVICYGDCEVSGYLFPHAWLEVDDVVVDIGIYGNINYGSFAIDGITAAYPYIGTYDQCADIVYNRFVFESNSSSRVYGIDFMPVSDYMNNSPKQLAWTLLMKILNREDTDINRKDILDIIENDIICSKCRQ